jgi:hypothetical protein
MTMASNTSCERSALHARVFQLCTALTLAVGLALVAPQMAAAQEGGGVHASGGLMDGSPQTRPLMLSFFTGIHYGYYVGSGFPLTLGGRFYIPLVHDGFIPPLNDEFGLEFGLDIDFTFLSSNVRNDTLALGFGIPIDVMWDFHISPNFDAYAKLGTVFGTYFGYYGNFWFRVREAVGLRLKITEGLYFRAEVGYPSIIAGLGLSF